jgi:glycine oxidase
MPDVLILGGGVIGLSLGYELAGQGLRVRILDRGQPGMQTSWAAAGILPANKFRTKAPPMEWLQGFSAQLHAEWAARLREETGIDNGYRRSGVVHLADSSAVAGELLQRCERWRREGLTVKWLHSTDLDEFEPALAGAYDRCGLHGAAYVAEEVQLRTPRHLKALVAACEKRGVEISTGVDAFDFEIEGQKVTAVKTSVGAIPADRVVIASGAWTQSLTSRLGLKIAVKPMRGQIVLLSTPRRIIDRIIEWIVDFGYHYLQPRDDGRLLVGTTMEDVGFDRRNTAQAISGMLQFATRLAPVLGGATLEQAWCGFRPASIDGLPYLGAVPGFENAFIATGHFRHGLWLSTGTAVVMSRLIRGESPGVDLTPFRVDRG